MAKFQYPYICAPLLLLISFYIEASNSYSNQLSHLYRHAVQSDKPLVLVNTKHNKLLQPGVENSNDNDNGQVAQTSTDNVGELPSTRQLLHLLKESGDVPDKTRVSVKSEYKDETRSRRPIIILVKNNKDGGDWNTVENLFKRLTNKEESFADKVARKKKLLLRAQPPTVHIYQLQKKVNPDSDQAASLLPQIQVPQSLPHLPQSLPQLLSQNLPQSLPQHLSQNLPQSLPQHLSQNLPRTQPQALPLLPSQPRQQHLNQLNQVTDTVLQQLENPASQEAPQSPVIESLLNLRNSLRCAKQDQCKDLCLGKYDGHKEQKCIDKCMKIYPCVEALRSGCDDPCGDDGCPTVQGSDSLCEACQDDGCGDCPKPPSGGCGGCAG